MTDELKLQQNTARISPAALVLALVLLGAVVAFIIWHYPHQTAKIEILHTTIYPAHVVFKSPIQQIGGDKVEDDLYVLAKVRVTDNLGLPLFLSDFTATLTTGDGDEFTSSAVDKQDIKTLYSVFPDIKPMVTEPLLLREASIQPKQSAEGLILFRFPVTQDAWKHRKSASLSVAFYHQEPQSVDFPADGVHD